MAMSNAEAQAQALAQQPPEAQASPAEPEQQMPEEVNLADLITSLNSGVGSQMAQPSAA
jgi:hypothetical protein